MGMVSEEELQSLLASVKLLALDVDGVLTDAGLYYSDSGEELKKFNAKDGMGMKLLMEAGVDVAIITASSAQATVHRAKKLGIAHTFIGVEDKLDALKQLCEGLDISLQEVAYAGDDVNDLAIMDSIGCPLTVADAMLENRDRAVYVTKLGGGQGAVREICDRIIKARSQSHNL